MITAEQVNAAHAQQPSPQANQPEPTAPAQAKPYTLHDRTALWTDSDAISQTRLKLRAKIDIAFDSQVLTSAQVISALARHDLIAPDVTALQRPRPGLFTISFADLPAKYRFMKLTNFTVDGHRPLVRDVHGRQTTYVSIRNAPPELPDAAIIARLKCFGEVIAFRRCFHADSRIENGHRTARMIINTPIPSYLRLASETIHVTYTGQTRTCRKCNRPDHEARNCQNYACFNCGETGHFAANCSEPTRCSICQSIAHKAYTCPYAVIDHINPDAPISATLADALAHVPVIPTAPNTADETDLTDADTLDRLQQETMDCSLTINATNNDANHQDQNNDPPRFLFAQDNESPPPPSQEPKQTSPTSSQETVISSRASAPVTKPRLSKKLSPALRTSSESHDADDDDCRSTTSNKRKDRPESSSDPDDYRPVTRRRSTRHHHRIQIS